MFKFSDIHPDAVEKRQPEGGTINGRFKIQKADGVGDIIDVEELEQAAYNFVELYREGGEMHERGGCAVLVESVIFTPEKIAAMGIPEGTVPTGWWIGFKVTDDDVWAKVKDGTYPMFSIEGEAVRVPEAAGNAAN